jgi:hypothetical protein
VWYGAGEALTTTTALGVCAAEEVSGTYVLTVYGAPGEALALSTGERVFRGEYWPGAIVRMNQWAEWP